MPFSKQPVVSTQSTKKVEFITTFDNRDGTTNKDVDLFNVFFEKEGKNDEDARAFKRDGLTPYLTLPSTNIRGIYYWEDFNRILVASGNSIYVYNTLDGALLATIAAVFGTVSGNVGFTEFLYDTNVVKIVATDGTTLGTIDSTYVWTASADADMPVPHLPEPVFLDGYLFLVKANTADIYNSNLNDPLAYTAGDFLSCEMFPDTVLKFSKLNNYLIAFGSSSIEYFWDAANATGSPLQRNDTPVKLIGYLGGFAQHANKIYFVGNSSTTTPEVFMLEDFKIEPVSNDTVRRYLGSLTSSLSTNLGNIVSCQGHDFYVMNVGTLTYVMDLKHKTWYRWGFQASNSLPITYSISVRSNTTYTSVVYITDAIELFKFSPTAYQDSGVSFTVRFTGKNQMYDSYNRKFAGRLSVIADRPTTDANLMVSWSDNDYQSFNTPRAINLNQQLPRLERGGVFRRRAYKFEFTANAPLRIERVELELNQGQS